METRSQYGTQKSLSSLLGSSGRKHLSESFPFSFPGKCSDSSNHSASEPVVDLDWTATPDGQSILAIGFPHHVLLLYPQRMTYFDQEPRWGVLDKYDISQCVIYILKLSLAVDDLIQSDLTHHHGLDLGIWCTILNSFGSSDVLDWSTWNRCRGQAKGGLVREGRAKERPSARLPPPNAFATPPLGYVQITPRSCVLTPRAEKFALVKYIITKLALELRYLTKDEWDTFEMPRVPIEAFLDDQDSGPNGVRAVFDAQPFH